MTAAAKVRNRFGEPINADDPCRCQIYELWGWDPWQRGIGDVCLWVGETARFPLDRIGEHFKDKYWRGDIRTVKVHPQVYPTKGDTYQAEEALTLKLQPVHSWEYNQDNPWVVRNQQGVHKRLPSAPSHWVTRAAVLDESWEPLSAPMSGFDRWWHSVRWWLAGAGAAWLGLFSLGAWLAVNKFGVTQASGAKAGTITATVLVGVPAGIWAVVWVRRKWDARQRRKERERRREQRRARR